MPAGQRTLTFRPGLWILAPLTAAVACEGLSNEGIQIAGAPSVVDGDGDGFSPYEGDCDDKNASVYPTAPEVCADGVVNDCESTEPEARASCGLSGQVDPATAPAHFLANLQQDLGGGLAMGDFDGDGRADLAAGAVESGINTDSGEVLLFLGLDEKLASGSPTLEPDAVISGDLNEQYGIRRHVATAGDLNADGRRDLLIGTRGCACAREVGFLFEMPLDDNTDLFDAVAVVRVDDDAASEDATVVPLGDLDGDSIFELGLGLPHADSQALGSVYVFQGPIDDDVATSQAAAVFFGEEPGQRGGASLGSNADLDGDGWQDLVIGGDRAAWVFLGDGGNLTNEVAWVSEADATLHGLSNLGPALALGDTDGDGRAELVLNDGGALLQFGALEADSTPADAVARVEVTASSVSLGDVDDDGRADLLYSEAEGARLVYGPLEGSIGAAHLTFPGASGAAILGADTNADGIGDIALSSSEELWLFLGQQGI